MIYKKKIFWKILFLKIYFLKISKKIWYLFLNKKKRKINFFLWDLKRNFLFKSVKKYLRKNYAFWNIFFLKKILKKLKKKIIFLRLFSSQKYISLKNIFNFLKKYKIFLKFLIWKIKTNYFFKKSKKIKRIKKKRKKKIFFFYKNF
jgi:hypothetical protein